MAAHVPTSSLSSELAPSTDHSSGTFASSQNILFQSRRQNELPVNLQESNSFLHVTIHHAKDLHNICIYGNQDVYARFSLTHCQDAVYSTQPVKAGGKNPVFNQSLEIPAPRPDADLKCEIWMMSCARNYLEDQLLGFALIPLGSLVDKGKRSQDYLLTATDLFFTPAGTVCLSLLFRRSGSDSPELGVNGKMFLDNSSSVCPTPASSPVITMDEDYQSIGQPDLSTFEFPDLDAASDNHASKYHLSNGQGLLECGITPANHGQIGTTVLKPIASPSEEVDCEMSLSSREEKLMDISPMPGLPPRPSYTSSCSNKNSSILSKTASATEHLAEASRPPKSGNEDKEKTFLTTKESGGSTLITPFVNLSMETEVQVVRQEIVDIYLKSLQQFTEKLAEMKLPLDAESQDSVVSGETKKEEKGVEEGRKVGSRLFYGSRAFY